MERQRYMLNLLLDICDMELSFKDYEDCRKAFKEMINLIRQMNYTEFGNEQFNAYHEELNKLIESYGK